MEIIAFFGSFRQTNRWPNLDTGGSICSVKPMVYLETTVPSYLAARMTSDPVRSAHQRITAAWWESRRNHFEICISQLVLDEASAGDPEAARARLGLIKNLRALDLNEDVWELASALVHALSLPARAASDAAHIAVATAHNVHFLLTWNCTHIANAELLRRIEQVCKDHGFSCPVICTPQELMGIYDL